MADMPEAGQQSVNEALELITKIWWEVVTTASKLLEADGKFGFHMIEGNLNPKLEDIARGLGFLEHILNAMADSPYLGHDERRMALNSKQCILIIRLLADALKAKDQEEYDKAIRLLDLQAKI
ncbi:hypothetical protein [Lysobacter sp. 22409]|uniref:hypothetical protein n=1 Tax=Lysobacter sp. 22409 TaxID=3453917 RepID=UPI003F83D246